MDWRVMTFKDCPKTRVEDKEFEQDVLDVDFSRHEFNRVYAVRKTFTRVNFKQAVLLRCYFRKCQFINCDFTGAEFKECNLRGAGFEGCTFDYCTWEKTQIEQDFLRRCLPTGENLARDVVRSLRVNFTQIGDYEAVNDAIRIEVRLNRKHYYNAAYSKNSYYRANYKCCKRFANGLKHAKWKFFDLLWGNGESIWRVLFIMMVAIFVFSIFHSDANSLTGYWDAVPKVFLNFWGIPATPSLGAGWLALLTATRFILFGMFMAILIKRLARR